MNNLTLVPFLLMMPACSFFMGEPQPAAEPSATAAAVASAAPSAVAASEPTATATTEPTTPAPKPNKTFSLVEHKLPLSIELPEDAKIEASQSKDGLGGARISSYPTVSLRILKADARLASIPTAKATLKKIINPAKTFRKEEKDLLVYDREGDDDVYFLMLVKIGGVTYSCQDLGGEPDEAALEPGIAACRSLKKAP
jgi:hypothetical protein